MDVLRRQDLVWTLYGRLQTKLRPFELYPACRDYSSGAPVKKKETYTNLNFYLFIILFNCLFYRHILYCLIFFSFEKFIILFNCLFYMYLFHFNRHILYSNFFFSFEELTSYPSCKFIMYFTKKKKNITTIKATKKKKISHKNAVTSLYGNTLNICSYIYIYTIYKGCSIYWRDPSPEYKIWHPLPPTYFNFSLPTPRIYFFFYNRLPKFLNI